MVMLIGGRGRGDSPVYGIARYSWIGFLVETVYNQSCIRTTIRVLLNRTVHNGSIEKEVSHGEQRTAGTAEQRGWE